MHLRQLIPALLLALPGTACATASTLSEPGASPTPGSPAQPLRVLAVVAHPDDEYCFAATSYRIARELGGTVDQVVITQGEGGFRYSGPSEKIYGKELSREEVGRKELPAIRRQELLNAGRILGIEGHEFLEQSDFGKSDDAGEALRRWDRATVGSRLDAALARKKYDLVLTLLPTSFTHGHHKAATILALEAVNRVNEASRPVVLGCWNDSRKPPRDGDHADEIRSAKAYQKLDGYPITQIAKASPLVFDRETPFGFKNRLNYQVYVSWMIAEHKSQGFFQTYYLRDDTEKFAVFDKDAPQASERAAALFARILPR